MGREGVEEGGREDGIEEETTDGGRWIRGRSVHGGRRRKTLYCGRQKEWKEFAPKKI